MLSGSALFPWKSNDSPKAFDSMKPSRTTSNARPIEEGLTNHMDFTSSPLQLLQTVAIDLR